VQLKRNLKGENCEHGEWRDEWIVAGVCRSGPGTHPMLVLKKAAIPFMSRAAKGAAYCTEGTEHLATMS
jgi:hypothetical protein